MEHRHREALARNLRRLRVARRWSLADLSAATGAGKATLSAIENARANPTVDTLASLARALDVELPELVEPMPADEVVVMRAGRGAPAGEGRERLGPLLGGEIQRLSLVAGTELEAPALAGGGRVHVVVTRGTLVAGPVERVVELGVGDLLSFPADRPHVFSTTRRAAEAVIVVERDPGRR